MSLIIQFSLYFNIRSRYQFDFVLLRKFHSKCFRISRKICEGSFLKADSGWWVLNKWQYLYCHCNYLHREGLNFSNIKMTLLQRVNYFSTDDWYGILSDALSTTSIEEACLHDFLLKYLENVHTIIDVAISFADSFIWPHIGVLPAAKGLTFTSRDIIMKLKSFI